VCDIWRPRDRITCASVTRQAVVSEADLALQLGKPAELVVTALDILLGEQRAQKATLNGYWKLLT